MLMKGTKYKNQRSFDRVIFILSNQKSTVTPEAGTVTREQDAYTYLPK